MTWFGAKLRARRHGVGPLGDKLEPRGHGKAGVTGISGVSATSFWIFQVLKVGRFVVLYVLKPSSSRSRSGGVWRIRRTTGF